MRTLTKKQKEVLVYIEEFIAEHGHAPSYGEIAQGLGLSSPSTVCVHVERLQEKGYLTKKARSSRSIGFPEGPRELPQVVELPLAGRIAAGLPIEAVRDTETIGIPSHMLGQKETYVLQVKGDSMMDDHVVDGDYVIVEVRQTAREGEMVVALVHDDQVTLKRFRRHQGKIRLEPANPAYEAQVYDEADVRIQGVVIGILRKYARQR